MPKQNERDYLNNLNKEEVIHAINKPFSDDDCGNELIRIGTIMNLIPSKGRLLDLGCGTGWTSRIFAMKGFEVLGIDISADMIKEARKKSNHLTNLKFEVQDYENLKFNKSFDIVVFYNSLHHAENEALALKNAFNSLKKGGSCVTYEPGEGHANSLAAKTAVQRFGVTEKDMPPYKIIKLGRKIGFSGYNFYPENMNIHPNNLLKLCSEFFYKRRTG